MQKTNNTEFETIIIGGSYAGLSAAMTLGRSLRKVLVIDNQSPCNRFATQAYNLVGFDGDSPQSIIDKIREQVLFYKTVTFVKGLATDVSGSNNQFIVTTSDQQSFTGKKVLLATGVTDILLDIPGFMECWGKTIVHCPYCHGYEIANKKIGIIAHGEPAFDMANLIRQWSPQIHILSNGNEDFTKEELQEFHANETRVITKEVKEVIHDDGILSKVIFIDGTEESLEALYVRVGVKQATDIPQKLGCNFDEHDFIIVDKQNRTNVPGLFASGDNMSLMRSLSVAIASGTKTGININTELIDEA